MPAFVGVSVATVAIGAGMFAVIPYLTLYLQNDLGYSPLAGGLILLPATWAQSSRLRSSELATSTSHKSPPQKATLGYFREIYRCLDS